jgi:hypothetical protein
LSRVPRNGGGPRSGRPDSRDGLVAAIALVSVGVSVLLTAPDAPAPVYHTSSPWQWFVLFWGGIGAGAAAMGLWEWAFDTPRARFRAKEEVSARRAEERSRRAASLDRVECPHCGKFLRPFGLPDHIASKHPVSSR